MASRSVSEKSFDDETKAMESNDLGEAGKTSVSSGDAAHSQLESALTSQPSKPAPPQFPEGGLRAWLDVAGATGLVFCSLGYCNAFGVFQNYYQHHQLSDRSPSSIAWVGSLQVFFLLAGNIIGGPLFDRHGGWIVWPPSIVFVFSIMMTSLCKEYYQFILCQGILGGIAMGMMITPGMASVGQYFRLKRGQAIGIAVAGSSLGGILFPIALSNMLYSNSLGFAWSIRVVGFWILAIVLMSCPLIRARLQPRSGPFILLQALTEVPFDLICFAAFLMLFGVFTPIFFLPEYAVAHGISSKFSTYLVAILNATSLFGRVIPGFLADKFGRLNLYAGAGICTGIMCMCWSNAHTKAGIIVFSAIYGFFSGAIISLQTTCIATVPKHPETIGTYLGMGMFLSSFGVLIGTPLNLLLVGQDSGFQNISIMSGVFVLVGGLLIIVVKYAMSVTEPEKGIKVFDRH